MYTEGDADLAKKILKELKIYIAPQYILSKSQRDDLVRLIANTISDNK